MCLLQFPLETEGMTQHSEYDKCLVKASDWEGFCNRMCGAVPLLGPGHASICSGASGCPCVCGHPHQPTRLGNQAPAVALLAGAAASPVSWGFSSWDWRSRALNWAHHLAAHAACPASALGPGTSSACPLLFPLVSYNWLLSLLLLYI